MSDVYKPGELERLVKEEERICEDYSDERQLIEDGYDVGDPKRGAMLDDLDRRYR